MPLTLTPAGAPFLINHKPFDPCSTAASPKQRATAWSVCCRLTLLRHLRRRVVLKSATNAGMGYGGMQALEEAYPVVADYDLVVHLHPDVLIYDCEALEARPRPGCS